MEDLTVEHGPEPVAMSSRRKSIMNMVNHSKRSLIHNIDKWTILRFANNNKNDSLQYVPESDDLIDVTETLPLVS